ncbi:DUF4159 domain-containing protein [Candidatus Palauibacter sp.]|uniref:DUF4159 domain-containing protein n=1 Tax=Candidatus Palauibacter sp. TaxID=3101350 RepID=UPI003C6EFA9F
MTRPRLAAASAVVSVLAAIAVAGATGSLAPDRAAVAPNPAAETATSPARSEVGLRDALREREPALAQTWAEWGRDFYFTRAVYSGSRGWGRGGGSWATDYPKADRQFLFILHRLLTMLDLSEWENPVSLADPELRRFPFLYMLEVGYMRLTEPEIQGLRNYLEAGGFLVVDDFWGPDAWANFEYHMSLVLPDRRIQPIPDGHPIFHQFYDIEQILTVPSIGNAMRGRYEECRGPCEPTVSGIFDDRGELMVVINHNTDLGDAWEWSENPYYPIDRSTYAYELAINYIIYGLSH